MPNFLTKFVAYSKEHPLKFNKAVIKKILTGFAVAIVLAGAILIIKEEVIYQIDSILYADESDGSADSSDSDSSEGCNVNGIELHGYIITYIEPSDKDDKGFSTKDESSSENIVYAINEADQNEDIKAILLEVDSYGGVPVAAEEIANAMKRASKPTIVLIRSVGTSAAYWAASGAQTIFASALSDVGGIGVTMSYTDKYYKNLREGVTYNSLSVGKFKDYGDSDKLLTYEEKNLIMRDLNITQENFIKAVAANRKLDINKVRALADGSSMPGQLAKDNGLVDKIGGLTEVKDYLKEKIGEEVQLCW